MKQRTFILALFPVQHPGPIQPEDAILSTRLRHPPPHGSSPTVITLDEPECTTRKRPMSRRGALVAWRQEPQFAWISLDQPKSTPIEAPHSSQKPSACSEPPREGAGGGLEVKGERNPWFNPPPTHPGFAWISQDRPVFPSSIFHFPSCSRHLDSP